MKFVRCYSLAFLAGHEAITIACRAIDICTPGAGVAAQLAITAIADLIIEAASIKATTVVGGTAMVLTGPV